jgi:predicted translin family RNA/ssDNA-binding protein
MAEQKQQDLLAQLSDLSEAAIQRLSEAPGADKALQALKKLGERVDELTRRTKGYEELEHRLSALEKKVSGLAKSEKASVQPKSASGTGSSTSKNS